MWLFHNSAFIFHSSAHGATMSASGTKRSPGPCRASTWQLESCDGRADPPSLPSPRLASAVRLTPSRDDGVGRAGASRNENARPGKTKAGATFHAVSSSEASPRTGTQIMVEFLEGRRAKRTAERKWISGVGFEQRCAPAASKPSRTGQKVAAAFLRSTSLSLCA
jgi:hypothetical protein